MVTQSSLLERLDRLESHIAIGQLPIRYALAVDSRDIDAWLELFVEDVDCGRLGTGRDALRKFIDPALRSFYRSHHQICGHAIDFVNADHATGKVYCRAEHEDGDKWIVMAICYFDTYARRNGKWYFVTRAEEHWYSADVLERPHAPDFQHWERWADRRPRLPGAFPTWAMFWSKSGEEELAALTRAPVGKRS